MPGRRGRFAGTRRRALPTAVLRRAARTSQWAPKKEQALTAVSVLLLDGPAGTGALLGAHGAGQRSAPRRGTAATPARHRKSSVQGTAEVDAAAAASPGNNLG